MSRHLKNGDIVWVNSPYHLGPGRVWDIERNVIAVRIARELHITFAERVHLSPMFQKQTKGGAE